MHAKFKVCIAFGTVCFVVASVIIALVLTQKEETRKTDYNQQITETIINSIQLPNGSYTVDLSNLKKASNKWTPLVANNSVLQLLRINADPTNDVLVSSRKTFLFVIMPSPGAMVRRKRDISSITGVGIQFGISTNLHVVPLPLTSTGQGFLKRGTLNDGSELYQIPVVAPKSMCSSIPGSQCAEIMWKAYAVGGQLASPSSSASSLSAACGSQCPDSQAASCGQSCETCGSGKVEGANTPRTVRFNLGRKVGTFKLTYQTYTVPDRIIVFQDEEQIFDTGCVGTGRETTASINFNGNSNEIRIDVEPNCDGTTSTEWFFEVICPLACNSADDKQVKLMNGGTEVQPGSTVYIDEDANMPSLIASYCKSDISASVSWSFKLTKSSTGKDDICNKDISLSSNSKTWDITKEINQVMGGTASLKWTLDDQSSGSLTFKILGRQPNRKTVLQYVNSKSGPWYAQYVATHESTQSSTIGPTQFDIKMVGYPLRTFDNGYGVMQLTNPPPTCSQIWSWKLNCDEGIRRLNSAASQAVTWMNKQRNQAKLETGNDVPVPIVNEGNCVFKENSPRTINDAVALKIFNGAEKQYCAWDNGSKKWTFVPTNAQGINYVNRICKTVPK